MDLSGLGDSHLVLAPSNAIGPCLLCSCLYTLHNGLSWVSFLESFLFLSPYLAMVEVFTAMGIGYDSGVALLPLSVQLLLQIIQF